MGAAYGTGGIGTILGPIALGIFAGGGNLVTPKATLDAVGPAVTLWAAVTLIVAIGCYFGIETRNKSIEEIDTMVHIPKSNRV